MAENELTVQSNTALQEKPGQLDYMSGDALNKAYKNAVVLSKSDLVPETYKGKPENVLLAMDMASRTGFSLMQIMQNLYIVRGKPSWSGSFCMNAIKACGKYDKVRFVLLGGSPTDRDFGVYVSAIDKSTWETVRGVTVTWDMVKSEGWDSKPGSKWKTMPELMFKYRAAAFFARTECPEVLQGVRDEYEQRDISGWEEPGRQKTRITLDDVVVESEVVS
nr:MAG TPA: RecT protein [Bacteriophage sp.]